MNRNSEDSLMSPTKIMLATLGLYLSAAMPALAQTVDRFYDGKQVRLIVGTGAGGGYDTYARLIARFLPKHIPGNPTFVVQNMPGASGIKAVNYLYSGAPKDGSIIATFNNAMPFYQMMGESEIQFDSKEFSWIGASSQGLLVLAVWHTTGIKTIEDAKKISVAIGATGNDGTMATYPALLNATIGTKFKIVTGYEGGNAVNLAMERGEVQGRGANPWESYKTTNPDWINNKQIIPLVQFGTKKNSDLPDIPLLNELAQNDEQRSIFQFVTANTAFERPYAAPPKIPAERLQILRAGFDATMNDTEFKTAADKQQLDLDPWTGAQLEKLVRSIVETPAHVVAKTKAAMTVK